MPDPTYIVRAGFATTTWQEIVDSGDTWVQLQMFTWADLSYGSVVTDVLRIAIFRQRASTFEPLEPGRAHVILDNFSGDYSPGASAALVPNKGLSVKARTDAGSVYSLFAGFIDRYTVSPDLSRRTTVIVARDRMKTLERRRVNVPMAIDTNAGSLFADVLLASGVVAAESRVDSVADVIPFAWFQDSPSVQAMDALLRFGHYQMYVDPAGTLRVKNRYWGLEATPVASYVNDFHGYDYTLSDDRVLNLVRIEGQPRKISTVVNTVAWLQERPSIGAGASVGFWLEFTDPENRERSTPARSVSITTSADYTTNTASDGSGTDRTANAAVTFVAHGASAVCSITNNAAETVFLTKFQLRGYSIPRQPQIQFEAADSSSQNVYGQRDFTLASDFFGSVINYVEDYADFLLRQRKEARPDMSIALRNVFPDVLARDLGDVIFVAESHTSVGSRFTIAEIEHDITLEKGLQHTATYGLRLWDVGPWLVLDHDPFGKLDSGRQLAF